MRGGGIRRNLDPTRGSVDRRHNGVALACEITGGGEVNPFSIPSPFHLGGRRRHALGGGVAASPGVVLVGDARDRRGGHGGHGYYLDPILSAVNYLRTRLRT
jgi:hypothetical protein